MAQTGVLVAYRKVKVRKQKTDKGEISDDNELEGEEYDEQEVDDERTESDDPSFFENFRSGSVRPTLPRPPHPFSDCDTDIETAQFVAELSFEDYDESSEEEFMLDPLVPARSRSVS